MNRKIKFRAWSNFYNDWIESFCVRDGRVHLGTAALIGNQVKDAILMQYTGLKDKNGKEIYEGDIVKHLHLTYLGYGNVGEDTQTVVIDDIRYLPFIGGGGDLSVEIIGNIYENPELLEGE